MKPFRLILFLWLTTLAGCQADQKALLDEATPDSAEPKAAPVPTANPLAQPAASTNRKIIKNANLRFRVLNFRESEKRIAALTARYGGLIAATEEVREGQILQNNMTLRVPAAQFDPFVTALLNESVYTDSKNITAEDVTKQWVDAEARLRSKRATEEKYLQLLKQARNVGEVLQVEDQLRKMREEIEVQDADLRAMKDQVALSTVHLRFYEQVQAEEAPGTPVLTRIGNNLNQGFSVLGELVVGLFLFVPLALVVGVPVWLIIRRNKHRKRVKNA